MAKKDEHKVEGLYLKVLCPVTGKESLVKLDPYDFETSSQECDLCGSHGHVGVDYKCPECEQSHHYTLRDW